MSERMELVNANIHKYIDEYILREIDLPRDLFVTLTRVETTKDLKFSKIFLSVIPDNKRGTALRILNGKQLDSRNGN